MRESIIYTFLLLFICKGCGKGGGGERRGEMEREGEKGSWREKSRIARCKPGPRYHSTRE